MTDPEQPQRGSVGGGILIGIGLHIVVYPVVSLVVGLFDQDIALTMLVACGLGQLVYMIPAMILCKVRGRPAWFKGIAIVTAITFLLNAACWGLVAASFSLH